MPGPAKKKFADRPQYIQFIIDQFAMRATPGAIAKMLLIHPEHPMEISRSTIQTYRKRYADDIKDRMRVMAVILPITDLKTRYSYLQEVIELGLEGQEVSMQGKTWINRQLMPVIHAIKTANDMQGTNKKRVDADRAIEDDDDYQTKRTLIYRDAFDKYLLENQELPFKEVVAGFLKDMDISEAEAREYIPFDDYSQNELSN